MQGHVPWQIKTTFDGLSPPRWLNKDRRGFFTTSQGKARYFPTRADVDEAHAEVQKKHPTVTFEIVEILG